MSQEHNQSELSLENLVEMSGGFSLDGEPTPDPQVVIDLDTPPATDPAPASEPTPAAEPAEPVIDLTSTPDNTFSDLVKEKLESGEWEDVIIELEDGTQKKLSELSEINKDLYKELEKAVEEEREREFQEKYVSIDGLDEVQKKLIAIVKSGDLETAKELFENPAALQEPFQGYDSDDEKHNEQVLNWYYTTQLGMSATQVKALIAADKADLSIDGKAQKIVQHQKEQFVQKLEETKSQIEATKKQEQEKIKEFRKDLLKEFKEDGISENLAKKFADVATKKGNDGNYEIDSIYDEYMSDPKKAKELIHFMLDREDFLKAATTKVKKDTNLNLVKRLKIVSDTTKTNRKQTEDQDDKNTKDAPDWVTGLSFNE